MPPRKKEKKKRRQEKEKKKKFSGVVLRYVGAGRDSITRSTYVSEIGRHEQSRWPDPLPCRASLTRRSG